jgi:hypothetical protein
MANNFTNLSTALNAMLQTGILEREFEEGLDSNLAYRRVCLRETVPNNIGETITRTRTSRKAPVTAPLGIVTFSNLDNGLTATDGTIEQYTFTMRDYGDTADVDLMANQAVIASNIVRVARNNGVQAAQSLERIARARLFSAYLGGSSYVRTDLGASSTTTCHVDDVTGFQTVLVNGVVTPISGGNPLSVQETTVLSGVTQVLSVTGFTVDATNHSQMPNGASGTITFVTATTPVNGDALVSSLAPKIIRPYGHITTPQMAASDTLTLGLLLDAVTQLRLNAVPPMDDGTYHCILDDSSMRQLWSDQQFIVLYAGRYQSQEYQQGQIFSLLGLTFIPTTETFIQPALTQFNGTAYTQVGAGTGAAAVNTPVRRPIVIGSEAIIEGDFEGLEYWLQQQMVGAIAEVVLIGGVAHIFRPPLDRMQRQLSLTWDWIGDFAVPTDATATSSIIPTANSALFKRAVVVEHSG